MKEAEGINYGYYQFSRYLEDLVGVEVSQKINESQDMLKVSLGASCRLYGGCGLIKQDPVKLIRSLFVIPIDNRKGTSKLFKYFLKDYDSEGKCVNTQSFNVKGYPLPRIGLLRRFSKKLVEEMKEYESNEKAFNDALAEEIIKIPCVVLPIEREIIEAHFNRTYSSCQTGQAPGLSSHPKRNINSLKSNAYAKRTDAVVVEPTISGLSGRYN